MGISLCMILKNEEGNLGLCLNSVRGLVDEIVVIDTGSTDRTKEIAGLYTDRIFDFQWCGDFSKARNFSIAHASNDWVLILDADERVLTYNREQVQCFIDENEQAVGRIKRINPFEDGHEIRRYIERVNRLFNRRYFQYEGIIHEQVVSKAGDAYAALPVSIEVDHIGYRDEVIQSTQKMQRNITMLSEAISALPQDPYLHYQIGKSYYKSKMYKEACTSFGKALELGVDPILEYSQDLVESYGYALMHCELYQKALELTRFDALYGKLPDYNFVMGLIFMNNARFKEAISRFEHCMTEGEGKIDGVNTYLPCYNLGVIHEALGQVKKAYAYYRGCGSYEPAGKRMRELQGSAAVKNDFRDHKPVIEAHIHQGDLAAAEVILSQYQWLEGESDYYSLYAVVKMLNQEYADAEELLKKALEIDEKNSDILYNLGYLYYETGKIELAKACYNKSYANTDDDVLKADIKAQIGSLEPLGLE